MLVPQPSTSFVASSKAGGTVRAAQRSAGALAGGVRAEDGSTPVQPARQMIAAHAWTRIFAYAPQTPTVVACVCYS